MKYNEKVLNEQGKPIFYKFFCSKSQNKPGRYRCCDSVRHFNHEMRVNYLVVVGRLEGNDLSNLTKIR